jgi:hypothetical protein
MEDGTLHTYRCEILKSCKMQGVTEIIYEPPFVLYLRIKRQEF